MEDNIGIGEFSILCKVFSLLLLGSLCVHFKIHLDLMEKTGFMWYGSQRSIVWCDARISWRGSVTFCPLSTFYVLFPWCEDQGCVVVLQTRSRKCVASKVLCANMCFCTTLVQKNIQRRGRMVHKTLVARQRVRAGLHAGHTTTSTVWKVNSPHISTLQTMYYKRAKRV